MFNDGDAEKLSQLGDLIPDGIYDASNYARVLSTLFDSIMEMNVNDDDPKFRIQFMMDCINQCVDSSSTDSEFSTENVSDVVTALSYFVMNLYSYLSSEQKDEFFSYHSDHMIPQTLLECQAMPFYEVQNMFPDE